MDNQFPLPSEIKELFKYTPHTLKKNSNNSEICTSELIGKIPIEPCRTKFKRGIYLTSHRGVDSRYLEDVLSIGYSPHERYSIDLRDLKSNFLLYNNEDVLLSSSSNIGDIKRVWPAFGQIGGATEFIAIPNKLVNGCPSENDEELPDLDECYNQPNPKCVKSTPEFTMRNAPRFQIFRADTVSPQPPLKLEIYFFLLRQILEIPELFGDSEILGSDPENRKWALFKISSSGLIIKSGTTDVTLSAGIQSNKNFCYVYIIGSKWCDKNGYGSIMTRKLYTTRPAIFHSQNPINNGKYLNFLKGTLRGAVNEIKSDLRMKNFVSERCIRLPTF